MCKSYIKICASDINIERYFLNDINFVITLGIALFPITALKINEKNKNNHIFHLEIFEDTHVNSVSNIFFESFFLHENPCSKTSKSNFMLY